MMQNIWDVKSKYKVRNNNTIKSETPKQLSIFKVSSQVL